MADRPTPPEGEPWYRDGLRFECTQCGNCCTGAPGHVWVTDDDIRAIAEYLDKPVGEIRLLNTRPAQGRVSLNEYPNGDCVYFDPQARRCTIYPVRPLQCRTWPFWKSNLATREDWQRTQQTCPGTNTGEFVSLDEIETVAAESNV